MKLNLRIFNFLVMQMLICNAYEKITVHIKPAWCIHTHENYMHLGTSWVEAGEITIKKKCKEWIVLSKLVLQWHGKQMNTLSGSLYKKTGKQLRAIEENHICDAQWNVRNQQLVLQFKTPIILTPTSTFGLYLSIANDQVDLVHSGYFTFCTQELPRELVGPVEQAQLKLAWAN